MAPDPNIIFDSSFGGGKGLPLGPDSPGPDSPGPNSPGQEGTGIPADKSALRRALLAARRGLGLAARAEWDAALARHVQSWLERHPARCLGVYWPIRGEPDLRPLYDVLAKAGARLALPVTPGPGVALEFAAWTPGDVLVKDAMGVAAPAAPRRSVWPDALLVPCVGFNAARCRLGYGGGFYDRTLAQAPRPRALGVAYACLAATFEAAPHDVALDGIATELGLL